MYLPVAPNSVSVSQRFVCVALVSPSTNSQDTKSPSRASAPHIETSAENKHTLAVICFFLLSQSENRFNTGFKCKSERQT